MILLAVVPLQLDRRWGRRNRRAAGRSRSAGVLPPDLGFIGTVRSGRFAAAARPLSASGRGSTSGRDSPLRTTQASTKTTRRVIPISGSVSDRGQVYAGPVRFALLRTSGRRTAGRGTAPRGSHGRLPCQSVALAAASIW